MSLLVAFITLLPAAIGGDISFNTSQFAVTLRSSSQTIDQLSPALGDPPSPTFSYACSSTAPRDRTAPLNHQLGDLSFQVQPDRGPYTLANRSIHCITGTTCVMNSSRLAMDGCRSTCLAADSCESWSWSRTTNTCYLLNGLTESPIVDPDATCGGKQQPPLTYSTSDSNGTAIPLHIPGELSSADLTDLLPGSPLSVTRHYTEDPNSGDLLMKFELRHDRNFKNFTGPVELSVLSVSMVFDQLFSGRSLAQVAQSCSFNEPFIGGGAGYVQVVSTTGKGPVLLVLPDRGLEGWRLIEEDPTPRSVTFEGFYQAVLHSKGLATDKWQAGSGAWWNPPSSKVIHRGDTYTATFRFTLAQSLREVDRTLIERQRPVFSAVPGFVLSPSIQQAQLSVNLPPGAEVSSVTVQPAQALQIDPASRTGSLVTYNVRALQLGRAFIQINVTDQPASFVHYFITPDFESHVLSYSKNLSAFRWYTDESDAFHRAPALMNTDSRMGARGVQGGLILQSQKAWISGLSDECGAAPSVGMAMSVLQYPQRKYIAQLEEYVGKTLWGSQDDRKARRTIQFDDYGIRASMFYSGKSGVNYTVDTWGTWDQGRAETTWRSYNYPHVTVVYWVLYRIARNYQGLTQQPWQFYLTQALNTTLGMQRHGRYNGLGLMVGSVWVQLLRDLHQEASFVPELQNAIDQMEGFMASRAEAWSKQPFPFGLFQMLLIIDYTLLFHL